MDFIAPCVVPERSPRAANEVFLVSDGQDVSTTELLCKVARAYGVKARLLPAGELGQGRSQLVGQGGSGRPVIGLLGGEKLQGPRPTLLDACDLNV